MSRATLIIFIFIFQLSVMSQIKTTIYFFPGQGSDKRIFDSLKIDPAYELKYMEFGTPDKNCTLKCFAEELSSCIDTSGKYILIGVSMGGMICSELNEILKPEKTIIISSAKNRNELPFRYRFQKAVPLYKLFPGTFLLAGAKVLQPIVEPDRNKNKEIFKSMLYSKDPVYVKRTVSLIINWERSSNSKKIYHIHGTNDHTLPFKKIKGTDHVISNGSHMMTLTRAYETSEAINSILGQ